MNNKNIALSKSMINKKGGVVILPLERWKKIERENLELRLVVEAIFAGELALKERKIRTFREFLKDEFHQYAKNI